MPSEVPGRCAQVPGCMAGGARSQPIGPSLGLSRRSDHLGVGQNQWDPILVCRCTTDFRTYFSGDWDVHWGYGLLTHSHLSNSTWPDMAGISVSENCNVPL